jgi:hypothetical protein
MADDEAAGARRAPRAGLLLLRMCLLLLLLLCVYLSRALLGLGLQSIAENQIVDCSTSACTPTGLLTVDACTFGTSVRQGFSSQSAPTTFTNEAIHAVGVYRMV